MLELLSILRATVKYLTSGVRTSEAPSSWGALRITHLLLSSQNSHQPSHLSRAAQTAAQSLFCRSNTDFWRALVHGQEFAKLSRNQCTCKRISAQTVGWAAIDTWNEIHFKAEDDNTRLGQGGEIPTVGSVCFRRATVRCISYILERNLVTCQEEKALQRAGQQMGK